VGVIGNFIHDPVITDAHAITACGGEFLHTNRAGLGSEIRNEIKDTATQRGWQCVNILLSTRANLNPVHQQPA
jgi:hypothetical protein